ncbi:MAG TPA: sugar phosphate nucleotidyltransferase [Patescibacteria group bacterium]|jgi:bifunctional UDP-N-acetylglucosamine pyrophosphorylase/glucosamine-1-phosphate N-acetyltransferase|nr:sugar phosphate nucleotidyltransferase [Patescibacteria group bacterium]
MLERFGAIVLAAGEGKRMRDKTGNKVTMELAGRPMILHTAELLKGLDVYPIVIVVGYQKHSVMRLFGHDVLFAEQRKRLGTAHAVLKGLHELPNDVEDILILQGDDSAFYKREMIRELIDTHKQHKAALTFLTIDVDNPTGLGRVIRDGEGRVMGMVEEKDATNEQRQIHEINPACYVMNTGFLRRYLPKVKKSPVTREYYLTNLIDIGIQNGEKVETVRAGRIPWRGVNTRDELREAERMLASKE